VRGEQPGERFTVQVISLPHDRSTHTVSFKGDPAVARAAVAKALRDAANEIERMGQVI
jgi:hypothetical protein